jgi:predicted O-methyltransferase YrrM
MTYSKQIAALYGERFLRKSALSIRDGAGVFEWALAGKGFGTVLEIGTYRGVAAAEMSRYCDRVITIDLQHGKMESMGQSFNRHELWSALGITNIELILVRDDAHKAKIVNGLQFDFAFVDGAHDQTVKDDFALVKRCGNVLFHDYDDRGQKHLNYVYDFVNSLPRHQVQVNDIFALWTDRG